MVMEKRFKRKWCVEKIICGMMCSSGAQFMQSMCLYFKLDFYSDVIVMKYVLNGPIPRTDALSLNILIG